MSFISSLNLLGAESPATLTEDAFTDELALWANAQFTFDTAPGTALLDDLPSKPESVQSKGQSDFFQNLHNFGEIGSDGHSEQNVMEPYLSHPYILPQIQPSEHHRLPRLAPASAIKGGEPKPILPSLSAYAPATAKKRKNTEEEANETLSVEDDKRRRNTAASARFRQKKKMREQALELTAKEMTAKTERLESRVKELEMEAKWLRALVVEKDVKLLSKENLEPSS
ncbi:hypothetical protein CLU79DRAFT_794374, partial [Phycomyces nitens]